MSSVPDQSLVVGEPSIAPVDPLAVSLRIAADMINVSERTMGNLIAAGEIAAPKIGTRRVVEISELRRWLAEKTEQARKKP